MRDLVPFAQFANNFTTILRFYHYITNTATIKYYDYVLRFYYCYINSQFTNVYVLLERINTNITTMIKNIILILLIEIIILVLLNKYYYYYYYSTITIITKTIIQELLYYYYLLHAVICQNYA